MRGGHVGRYRLIGLLATGGMAQVFLALSGELSGFRTPVVVKRVLPHLASNAQFIRMFFDEARIAALLDHPNIARIIEVGQDGDEYFLAMEVVQGRPLSAVLRKGVKRGRPLTHAQSAFIVAQAANGLGYAHNLADASGRRLNVVHRDVSPQNILVSFEGAVKVIDFGVARALGRVTETVPGGLKGKIQYMAPEQAASGTVDHRSDVFALGVVLWEALCGRRLFRRENELATLRAIVDEPILPPSRIVRISPRLERIVMQALDKNPANRFQNAQGMALALERHAFASEGFGPAQIATAMKDLFAADYTRWKKTVAAAMELDGAPEQWSKTSGTFLRPHGVDLHTQGSTVALHGSGKVPPVALTGHRREHSSDSRSLSSGEFSLPDAPSGKTRPWFAVAGLAVAAALMVPLAWMTLSPPASVILTIVRPATSASLPMAIEVLSPPPSAASPVGTDVLAGAPPSFDVPLDPSHDALTSHGHRAVPATPPPSRNGPLYDDLVANFAPVPPPANGRATNAVVPARKMAAHHVVQRRAPGKPTARPAVAAPAPGPAATGTATAAVTPTARATRASGTADEPCAIKLGTQPWAEVWIDGKNTGGHTPHVRTIACGAHKVTFKRPDLKITRSIIVFLRPGETLKRSLSLRQD